MKRFICTFFLLVIVSIGFAQSNFEGRIEFEKTEGGVVTSYVYLVKGDKIRITKYGHLGKIVYSEGTDTYHDYTKREIRKGENLTESSRWVNPDSSIVIIDLHDSTIVELMYERKSLWYFEPQTDSIVPNSSNFSLIVDPKLSDKNIVGFVCKPNVIKLNQDNTEVAYWIGKGNFNFFKPMISLKRNKEFFPAYMQGLVLAKGAMPFYLINRTYDGTAISTMKLVKVDFIQIADYNFEIPAGYTKFAR